MSPQGGASAFTQWRYGCENEPGGTFSDGVIAIMVLEIRLPHGTDARALGPLLPMFLSYVLSFVYVGIYWSNHHPVFQVAQRVNGRTLSPLCICCSGCRWFSSRRDGSASIMQRLGRRPVTALSC